MVLGDVIVESRPGETLPASLDPGTPWVGRQDVVSGPQGLENTGGSILALVIILAVLVGISIFLVIKIRKREREREV